MERIFTYGKDLNHILLLKSGIQLSDSFFIPLRGISCIEIQNNNELIFELNSGSVVKIVEFSGASSYFQKIIIHFENWKTFTVKTSV